MQEDIKQLKQTVASQQIELDALKSSSTIPLAVYQAFLQRFFNNPTLSGNILINGKVGINGAGFSGGEGVLFIQETTIGPGTPIGGGIIYVASNGKLRYVGPAGTTTDIANS